MTLAAGSELPPWVRLVRDVSVPYGLGGASARDASDAAPWFARIRAEEVEVFCAAYLDGRHQVLAVAEISRGTVTATLVHPREVFRPAIALGAAAVIVAHNHPSGNVTPSPEDWSIIARLRQVGELVGIRLLDSLVVAGAEGTASMAQMAQWGNG